MIRPAAALLFVIVMLADCAVAAEQRPAAPKLLTRIAFGSCSSQAKPQPIWEAINAARPELFIYLGDNIYADTADMTVMREKYDTQLRVPGFAQLRKTTPIIATWDDHDYGFNDSGAEYSKKAESQKEFLRFMDEPADSPRRKRAGVYDSYTYGPAGQRVQVIMLDTRYFRSPLVKINPNAMNSLYKPTTDPTTTVLGEEQWKWLEEQLRIPADIRIIGSSIQLVTNDHLWEHWGNFPHERQRFYKLLRDTKANGVIVISGDRHRAEISRDSAQPLPYTLWDITSSGLNQTSGKENKNEPNRYRVGENYLPHNFGMLLIDWAGNPHPTVMMEIRSVEGEVVLSQKVNVAELKP